MIVDSIELQNWMNFKSLEQVSVGDRLYVIGANAVGKSNFLDAFRFLRDVALPAGKKPSGGGLQKAVQDRGGLSRLRCLNAGKVSDVRFKVRLHDDDGTRWEYELGFKGEGRANNRIVVTKERVLRNGERAIADRPDKLDNDDHDRLTQTALEDVKLNRTFRPLAHFFSEITYLHLVPQLLKFADQIGGNRLTHDPFGQSFLERLAATPTKTREARLSRMGKALAVIVPQFKELRFRQDEVTSRWHIEANFKHWREKGAWQRESQFSDGTLRLLGLLWSLLEGSSLLLLEEPELSLNEATVKRIPSLFHAVQRGAKSKRQIIVTTHSEALLTDSSISLEQIIRFEQHESGTKVKPPAEEEKAMVAGGFTPGHAMLAGTRPEQLELLIIQP